MNTSEPIQTPCVFCGKDFIPGHHSRGHVHRVFRVRTKYGYYSGPVHCMCVTMLSDIQTNLMRDPTDQRLLPSHAGRQGQPLIPAFLHFETVH